MPTDPNVLLENAQAWITAITTIAGLIAAALIGLAMLFASTRKKLRIVLQGVEESGSSTAKHVIEKKAEAAGVQLDNDILAATGKPTKRLKRRFLVPIALIVLPFFGCRGPDLKPTLRENRLTIEHFREDYRRAAEGVGFVSSRVAAARVVEADAAIANAKLAEELK